jgi:hypothetical protein
MRMAYVHEAVLAMEADADTGAPGAVTKALCGHWDHEPPCPLAPHHSAVSQIDSGIELRVLFAVEPELESAVRRRIEAALAEGHLDGPEGEVWWTMTSRRYGDLLEKLGPHTTGVGCIHIKDVSQVNLDVLGEIVAQSYTTLTAGTYGHRARDAGGE